MFFYTNCPSVTLYFPSYMNSNIPSCYLLQFPYGALLSSRGQGLAEYHLASLHLLCSSKSVFLYIFRKSFINFSSSSLTMTPSISSTLVAWNDNPSPVAYNPLTALLLKATLQHKMSRLFAGTGSIAVIHSVLPIIGTIRAGANGPIYGTVERAPITATAVP